MGKRLGDLTQNNTKCMVRVDGIMLIDRVLKQLSSLTLNKVILVIGYKGTQLKEHIGDVFNGMPIEYVENPIYDKTNNIYSLSLVKDELRRDDTLLLESDLIFDDTLLHLLMDSAYPNAALVDKYETWMDGTMVRLDEEHNIVNFIPKKDFSYEDVCSYYKTVNVYKFSKDFLSTQYVPFLEAYTKALGNNEYYEQVLRVITLLDNCDLKAIPLSGQNGMRLMIFKIWILLKCFLLHPESGCLSIRNDMAAIGDFLICWIIAIWSIHFFLRKR